MGMRLFEIQLSQTFNDAASIHKFMVENCSQWLSQTNPSQPVYKGMRKQGFLQAFTRPIRTNRIPLGTSDELFEELIMIIKSLGGVANRNNSSMVTGADEWAQGFGEVYVFLPVGPFHYTWSPVISDWFLDLEDSGEWKIFYENDPESLPFYFSGLTPKEKASLRLKPRTELEKIIEVDKDLRAAIDSENEILVSAEEALLITVEMYEKLLAGDY